MDKLNILCVAADKKTTKEQNLRRYEQNSHPVFQVFYQSDFEETKQCFILLAVPCSLRTREAHTHTANWHKKYQV